MLREYQGQKSLVSGKIWLALGLACFWIWGCAYPSRVELDYGRSVRNNQVQQLVNPAAGLEEATPTVGLAPKPGEIVWDRYCNSFKKPKKEAPAVSLMISE
jgi:hypothetical protein